MIFVSFKMLAPSYFNRFKKTMENAGSGQRVLNIGCGDGEYDLCLSERFESTTGLDINRKEISFAKQNGMKNSSYALADGTSVPFRDETFDCVICIDVLEHAGGWREIISEIHRVLKKSGCLVISVPNRNYPFTYDPLNFLLRPFGKHARIGIWGFGHLRLYRGNKLSGELEEAGFKINRMLYLNHYLAGLCENYLSTIFQKTAKPKKPETPGKPPEFLIKMVGLLVKLDQRLFKNSKTSIGILAKAVKK